MRAIVCTRYGSPEVLHLEEVSIPVLASDEVLVKICAASVNPLDSATLAGPWIGRLFTGGLLTPKFKVLGADIAGRVEAVGRHATHFRPGDEVFGGLFAGAFGGRGLGGFAEYVVATEDKLAHKPGNLSFEQAAAIPIAAVTALQGLRDSGRIQAGQRVLIDGASGGVGTFAIQIAKAFNTQVTAVCSTRNTQTAQSLGADFVIDYSQQDFTAAAQRYDLIFAANAHHSIFDYRRALAPQGRLVVGGGGTPQMLQALLLGPLLSRTSNNKIESFLVKITSSDLTYLKGLCEAGRLIPVIDRRYTLSNVADAIRYLAEGHARGKVVINIANCDGAKPPFD
jgi:NADPH:quinone reductase-like Zn-dependent oxidoreductase